MKNMLPMIHVLIMAQYLSLLLTPCIFKIREVTGIGLHRPIHILSTMRGMQILSVAVIPTLIKATAILFGWYVSDIVFSVMTSTGNPALTLDEFWDF
jgi:hypothetical protein